MKKLLSFILLVVLASNVWAQTPKNLKLINSSEIINDGITYVKEQKYVDAERLYKTIPLGDSLYYIAQYELAYCYSMQERYDEALEICQTLLDIDNGQINENTIYTLMANSYSNSNQLKNAMKIYDYALKLYPYHNNTYFSMGAVYEKMKQYSEMEGCAKMAIFCNPSFQNGHYQLGIAYLRQQYFVPGILALNYAMMLNPNTSVALECRQTLEELYTKGFDAYNKGENVVLPNEKKANNKKYQRLEQLLQKNVEPKADIKQIITRQNQLIFENLEHNTASTEIEEQLYIPTFKMIMKEKADFDAYSYLIFQETDIENKSEEAQEMEQSLPALYQKIIMILKEAMDKGLGKENKEGLSYTYYGNYNLESFGKNAVSASGEKFHDGQWSFIDAEGKINMKGGFIDGKQDGNWVFYDRKGNLIRELDTKNGKENGKFLIYFFGSDVDSTQQIQIKTFYEDGKITGKRYEYNRSGVQIEQSEWKDNFYNGLYLSYYPQGNLKTEIEYKEGNINGKYTGYYQDGKTVHYKIDVINGDTVFVRYYPDGKIQLKAALVGNGYVGDFSTYYSNGKIRVKGQYDSLNKENGQWTEYSQDGNINYTNSYENGTRHGDEIHYSLDGKQIMKVVWKNGLITEVIYYNPNGTEKERKSPKDELLTLDFYFTDADISYLYRRINVKNTGDLHGKRYFYAPDGTVLDETDFVDNLKHGISKTYYPNGKLKTYCDYKNGMGNGMYLEYDENDTLISEGYLKDDFYAYIWYRYYPNGSISELNIYNERERVQQKLYYPNGQLSSEVFYKNDMIAQVDYYNHEGKLLKSNLFENGNGELQAYYLNGNIKSKTNVKAGQFIGTCVHYTFDGKELPSVNYVEGLLHGNRRTDNSILILEENYLFGNEYGVGIKIFHGSGEIDVENYLNGGLEGGTNNYFEDRYPNSISNYVGNVRQGISTYYAADGKTIRYQLKYNNGQIYAYSYMNKDGKMTEFLPMGKEKTKIVSYYSNGTKSSEIIFENYLRQGKEMIYYPNGKVFLEKNYVDDKYHGLVQAWLENETVKYKEYYQQNQLQGICKYYYDNGKPNMIINYVDDLPHGAVELYDKDGKLIETQTWFYDYRIK